MEQGGGVLIGIVGNGRCAYRIDYGDGTSERRDAELHRPLQSKRILPVADHRDDFRVQRAIGAGVQNGLQIGSVAGGENH